MTPSSPGRIRIPASASSISPTPDPARPAIAGSGKLAVSGSLSLTLTTFGFPITFPDKLHFTKRTHFRRLSTEPLWRSRGLRDGPFRLTPDTPPLQAVHLLAFLSPCTTMARRDVLLKYGGFYEHNCRYAEDAWLWLQVMLNEPLALRLEPHVNVHFEASGLSNNRARQSPIEPFLEHPEPIEAVCPAELRPLLAQMLAIRAFKRACVYGYWGRWREAGPLRRRFTIPGASSLPYYFPALAAGTPLASLAGAVLRSLRR